MKMKRQRQTLILQIILQMVFSPSFFLFLLSPFFLPPSFFDPLLFVDEYESETEWEEDEEEEEEEEVKLAPKGSRILFGNKRVLFSSFLFRFILFPPSSSYSSHHFPSLYKNSST